MQEKSTARFKSHFYLTPFVCALLFLYLQRTDNHATAVEQANPIHLLLGLLYLKEYPTKHGLACFSTYGEKKALSISHSYVEKIQALKEDKVRFNISCYFSCHF